MANPGFPVEPFRRYHGYASRYYYRRGSYARRPRRRFRLF